MNRNNKVNGFLCHTNLWGDSRITKHDKIHTLKIGRC